MGELKCLPILRSTDGPLFGSKPGVVTTPTNMRIRPGGYAEFRGGFEDLKPNGGTAADAISAGGYSCVHQVSSPYGWVRRFDNGAAVNSQYSVNLIFHEGGFYPFDAAGGAANTDDALYFGDEREFSRIGLSMAFPTAVTHTYEYWNGAWTALTTAETIDFNTTRTPQFASWTLPTDWVASTRGDSGTGNVLKKWMRIRVTALAGGQPTVGRAEIFGTGGRELYAFGTSPRTSATSGSLKRHGQTGTTEEWFTISSSLYSAFDSDVDACSYRGRLIYVNGKETNRFDGANHAALGIPAFTNTINLVDAGGGTLATGLVFRYYVAWGCGPCLNTDAYADRQDVKAMYGPGRATYVGEITLATGGGNRRTQIEMTTGAPAGVSAVYIYRTDDLTNVASADRGNAPAFLIQSLRLRTGGAFETNNFGAVGQFYYDDNLAPASPYQEAVNFDNSPPVRCRYALVHQNRLLLGDNETWYISDPFFPDSFKTKDTTG